MPDEAEWKSGSTPLAESEWQRGSTPMSEWQRDSTPLTKFDPKTYDPKVKEGEYPVTGPVDWLAQKFEHVTPGAEYVGTALDTLRRPVASLIAGDRRIEGGGGVGDRLKLAYHSGPALLGGNPDLAPTPEETKHALGVKDLPDKPGFDAQGNINWGNVLTTKVPNEAGNVVTGILTDPSSYFTFGAGRAAQAAKAAKTEALALKATGKVAEATAVLKKAGLPAMPLFDASTDAGRAAMESYLKPSIQQTIAGGDAALKLHPPHLPLIPKIPGELQLRIPKFLAPIGRVLEPLGRDVSSIRGLKWTRAFANPDPSAPHEIVARLSDAEAKMRTSGMMKEVNVSEEILKKGSGGADGIENAPGGIDKALNYASDLTEQFAKTGERLFGEGPPLQFSDEGNGFLTEKGRFVTRDEAAKLLEESKKPVNTLAGLSDKEIHTHNHLFESLGQPEELRPYHEEWTRRAAIPDDLPKEKRPFWASEKAGSEDLPALGELPEKIVGAAWRRPSDGKIFTGATHADAMNAGGYSTSPKPGDPVGRFRTGDDAQIAKAHALGLDPQTSPNEMPRIDNIDKVLPGYDLANKSKAAFMEKSNFAEASPKIHEAMDYMSGLQPRQRATMLAYINHWKDAPARLLAVQQAAGLKLQDINLEKLVRPDIVLTGLEDVARGNAINGSRGKATGLLHTDKVTEMLSRLRKAIADPVKNAMPTPDELALLANTLAEELPQAVKEFNNVPNYRPGSFSNAARIGKPRPNPNLSHVRTETDVTMKRESENGPASGARDIPGVRKTVLQMNIDRERGSFSSEGVPLSNREEGWFSKYVVPEGYKDAQRALRETAPGATTFEGRIDQAFAKQIAGPIYQSLRQDAFEAMAKRIWNAQPDDAINAVKNEARNGVYVSPGIQRPATLADVQKKFTAKGGIGDVRDLLNPQAIKDLDAGTLSIEKAFNREWSPYNRAPKDIKGVTHWMHGDTVRVLDETQKLGTDPYKLGRFLWFAAPMVTWMNDAWRKNATYRGPQFLAYTIRNDIGDMSRMRMGEMLDAMTVADKIRLLGTDSTGKLSANGGRMAEFFKTGDPMKLQGMRFNAGPMGMIDGPTLAKLYQKVGLSGTGELAGDVLGNYMPKNTSGVDNSWAGQLSRKSSTVKAVVGAAEKAGDWAKTINAAREEANRFAGFVTRLRAGDTPNVAAVRVTEALFDFRRLSPAAHALRATGLVPFASWHSKVYPYVLKYAVEHPGEFIATIRVLQAFQQKEIDESQIPEWMQGKHNMIVRKFKNPVNGHNELGIQTASGVLPMMDMMELASDPSGKVGEMLGPLVKTFWDIGRMNLASEENKHSAGENAWQLGEDIVGRPASSARQLSKIGKLDPRTGETRTGTDWAMNQVLPMHSNQIDMTTTGQVSVGVAKKNLTSSLISVASAKMELGKAQAYLQKQRGDLNTVSLMTKDQYALKEYVDRVQTAQAKMLRMQRAFTQAQQAQARNQKVFEGMSRAP